MARYARKTAILAKIEGTYGTDATPTGADALLVSDCSVNRDVNTVDRSLVRPYHGASEKLKGVSALSISYTVELAGSGTPSVAPAWGKLLQACGFAEDTGSGSYVSYQPDTESVAALTQYYYDAGGNGSDNPGRYKALGSRGTAELNLGVDERPTMQLQFKGIDGGLADAAMPTTTLSSWNAPVIVTDGNSIDFSVGSTFSTAAGTLGAGTAYASTGLRLNLGNNVVHQPLIGSDTVEITAREIMGSVELDLTAAQQVTFRGYVDNGTLVSIGFQHGNQAGNIVLLHAPKVQLTNERPVDREGRRLMAYDLVCTPNTGDDELRIVTK